MSISMSNKAYKVRFTFSFILLVLYRNTKAVAPYFLGNWKHWKASWSTASMDIFAQKPNVLPEEVLRIGTGPGYVIC